VSELLSTEAFLIRPQFTASDLWVWPVALVLSFVWIRKLHGAAGVTGRDIDALVSLKALSGVAFWGSIIAVGGAIHRVTDNIFAYLFWIGVSLVLSFGMFRGIIRFTPLASVDLRARTAIGAYRAELKAQRKTPGKSPLNERRHTSALISKDLFAESELGPASSVGEIDR